VSFSKNSREIFLKLNEILEKVNEFFSSSAAVAG
jgi:hypothetical protein